MILLQRKRTLFFIVAFLVVSTARAQVARRGSELLVPLNLVKQDLVVGGHSNIQGFSEGGQFEILVRPGAIPASAPGCRSQILIRMPWSDPDSRTAQDLIVDKKKLFDEFEALRSGSVDAVSIVIDLSPYGHVVAEKPLRVRLTMCNVFFVLSKPHVLRQL